MKVNDPAAFVGDAKVEPDEYAPQYGGFCAFQV
jgi:hypothetical protein